MVTRVLDTNLVSYRLKGHTLADVYRPHLEGHTLAISFMTVAELLEGAFRAGWDKARREWLKEAVASYQILESSPEICQHWGEIRPQRYRQPISVDDAWIAATARAHGFPLVTHNPGDFQGIPDLQLITEHVP